MENNDLGLVFILIRERLLSMVSRIVPPSDIEDIVQEAYVRACQVKNKQPIVYPRTFLYKTARNLAIDYLKRADVRLNDSFEGDENYEISGVEVWADEPYQRTVSNNDFALFCQAVRLLPRECRRSFVLKKVYDLPQKEVARRLGISESTVEKHVSMGIRRCAHFMSKRTEYGKKMHKLSGLSNDRTAQK